VSAKTTTAAMMELADAQRCSGVSSATLIRAIRLGHLSAIKIPHKSRGKFLVESDSLISWLDGPFAPKRPNRPWSDADNAALRDLRQTCTTAQIAAYLGRTANAVAIQLAKLRASSSPEERIPDAKTNVLNPFNIPPSGVLLAKTCLLCGRLRHNSYFSRRRLYYAAHCRVCGNKRKLGQSKYGPYRQNVDLLQEITYAQASNERKRYTEDELETISDETQSDLSVALKLGRSYFAVTNKRQKLGIGNWGKGNPRKNLATDGQWEIDFPEAMQALRNHFETLGRPVPEELWEWTDDVAEVVG
jgi:hypothetical protein